MFALFRPALTIGVRGRSRSAIPAVWVFYDFCDRSSPVVPARISESNSQGPGRSRSGVR